MKTVIISGGFDPLHDGHIDYITHARKLGHRLVVLLNSDDWLIRKKGYCLMPFVVRERVLMAMGDVDKVLPAGDADGTCLPGIKALFNGGIFFNTYTFANGGDRVNSNTPETKWCLDNGVAVAFNIGGAKVRSSSELMQPYLNCIRELWCMRPPGAATNSLREAHRHTIAAAMK